MNDRRNGELKANAQNLRKNMTKEERHLWYDFLKNLPCDVKRQKPIGNYIVDFYIPSFALIIEIDGSQHYEERGKQSDSERDKFLSEKGFHVIRYSNSDINKNFEAVCKDILLHMN